MKAALQNPYLCKFWYKSAMAEWWRWLRFKSDSFEKLAKSEWELLSSGLFSKLSTVLPSGFRQQAPRNDLSRADCPIFNELTSRILQLFLLHVQVLQCDLCRAFGAIHSAIHAWASSDQFRRKCRSLNSRRSLFHTRITHVSVPF